MCEIDNYKICAPGIISDKQIYSAQTGVASKVLISPCQGKLMRREKSIGAVASSRDPYLWSPTRGNPRLENCTRI